MRRTFRAILPLLIIIPYFGCSPSDYSQAQINKSDEAIPEATLGAIQSTSRQLELGAVHHPYQSKDVQEYDKVFAAMEDAGLKWMRFLFIWNILEPEDDHFDWDAHDGYYDKVLEKAAAHGIKIIGEIAGAPDHVNGTKDTWAIPSGEDFQKFKTEAAEFAYHAVARYKKNVHHWEVWNEPNLVHFWHPEGKDGLERVKADQEAPRYVEFLAEVSSEIKRADSEALVMNGGVSNSDIGWLEAAAEAGIGDHIDAVAFHLYYPKRDFLNKLKSVIDTMQEHGLGDKPLYITEMGWSTHSYSEEAQAEELASAVEVLMRYPQVPVALIYQLRDESDNPHGGDEAEYGLMRMDFTAKKSYLKLKEFPKKNR